VPGCFGWPKLLVVGLAKGALKPLGQLVNSLLALALVVALVLVAVSVERLIVPVCFG
jgi:hypothetical protein